MLYLQACAKLTVFHINICTHLVDGTLSNENYASSLTTYVYAVDNDYASGTLDILYVQTSQNIENSSSVI